MAGLKTKTKSAKQYGFSTDAIRLTAEAMNVSLQEAEKMLQKLEDQEGKKLKVKT